MADVDITPKIRCDNCGFATEKSRQDKLSSSNFVKPRLWGSLKAEGGRICQQTYGTGKERLDLPDLCSPCAEAALVAAAEALKARRSEDTGEGE